MSRLNWLLFALGCALVLFAINTWALAEYLYWTHRWLDVPMHLLGGVTIAALLTGVLGRHRPLTFFLLAAFFALGWEVYEYLFNLSVEGKGYAYVFDTLYDLVNGSVGIVVTYVVARKTVWRST